MTARDSSSSPASPSSAASRNEPAGVDLLGAGLLPRLPAALLSGRDPDLLAPLTLLDPGEAPSAPPPGVERSALARALGTANESYGHPRAAVLAGRLADPATRVVVTGQQPGLLGGPLYTLSKAVAAGRLAADLEARGEPAVAVFWVATEDHDYGEVSRTTVLAPDGARALDLGDDPAPLTPVGMRTLGAAIEGVLDEIAAAMPGDRYADWVERLRGWYRPDARFGEAFCRLLAGLLGERCPLLLDSMLPAVKEAERPLLRRLVERREEVGRALAAREGAIEERGHPLQVHPQPGMSPLFLLQGRERRRIRWCDGGRFSLRGADDCDHEVASLLETLEDNPGVVSPGVQARPLVQDAILGTWAQVLGPGELSYMPQVAPLYDLLEVAPPRAALRPQVLVLEEHQLDKLDELGLGLAELVHPDLDLDAALARGAGDDFVTPVRDELEAALERLRDPALGLDPNLERPWEKTRDQILRGLDTFSGKVTSALARRNDVARGRALALREACRPQGKLQERVVSTSHFPGKHGDRFIAELWRQLDFRPGRLQVVRL